MQTVFSTHNLRPQVRLQRWRKVMYELITNITFERLSDKPFQAHLDYAQYGSLTLGRLNHGYMRASSTKAASRSDTQDELRLVSNLEGRSFLQHDDREAVCHTGDFTVTDHRPAVHVSEESTNLLVNLPRDRIERMLGPSRLFTAIPIGQGSASASLTTSFFRQLIEVGGTLGPEAAERMASIGIDLIVASIAERLAQEAPRPVHGTLVVQRAKAYVEANLGDPSLDPRQLAAAMGVSLRRLQELFNERGRHISDHIWERRLAAAARRLADPACTHLSVGTLAYGCGFSSQAHFARRFKDRYGLSPRDYRRAQRQDCHSVASAFGLSS
jgi:AraC-like DNA-binding protein